MANVGQDREESVGSQRENQFINQERRRDKQHTRSVVVESYHMIILNGVIPSPRVMLHMIKRH